jgi:hypothetical protein
MDTIKEPEYKSPGCKAKEKLEDISKRLMRLHKVCLNQADKCPDEEANDVNYAYQSGWIDACNMVTDMLFYGFQDEIEAAITAEEKKRKGNEE